MRIARKSATLFLLTFVAALAAAPSRVASATVLPDFVIENAFPGVQFTLPTAIAFTPDGRLLVAEKRGIVWVVEHGALLPQPLWSAEREVLNNGDRGLVGIAVDPSYAVNHRVYFFYTVDPDSNGVDTDVQTFTRLVRYETSAADSNVVDPASRRVLIGRTWSDGILSLSLSHAVDCLRFGSDGSLLVTHGDGSHFDQPDTGGLDSAAFVAGRGNPAEDIGAFRSQFIESMNGKLLRINPENGNGYASNPYVAGDLTAPRARVWAYGFRNPFRFCVRPGTGSTDTAAANPGTIFVGDVGAATWEELDVVTTPGGNYGWPCREAMGPYATYANASPAHHGCSTIGTATNPGALTAPHFYWNHDDSTRSLPYGVRGNCTAGGVFYDGARYPEHYRGRLFFGDFGGGWAQVATLDAANAIVQTQGFASDLEGPVDWAIDPAQGEILYVSLYTGEMRRIRYVGGGGEQPLVAQASATPLAGPKPLAVQFSSLGSVDYGGSPLSFAWSFGDGTPGSTAPHPLHVYAAPGDFSAILTVSNGHGGIARDTVNVIAIVGATFPTTPVVDSFARPDGALASPWAGNLSGLAVRDSALVQTGSSNYATWGGTVFGPNQEAYVTFDSLNTSAIEHDLLLKVQGPSWSAGALQVVYSAPSSIVSVSVYTPGIGWTHIAGPWRNITFRAGDRFGARAFANGVVEVFKNQEKLGDCMVDTWRFCKNGGRIGLMLNGAARSRLTHFGGGDALLRDDEPPVATLVAPLDGSFFVAGDHVVLRGSGSDPDDAASTLRYAWDVTLRHNNHFHPDIMTFTAQVDSFEAENHDDGTGISFIIRLVVTDPRGAADSASVAIYPEVNLAPGPIVTTPEYESGDGVAECAFAIANHGRMPAPRSRWRLLADGVLMAEGDTVVSAEDSVRVTRTLTLQPGTPHVVRVVIDALGEVPETDETDNQRQRSFGVRPFPTSRVIDDFDRPDAPLSSPWIGSVSGLEVRDRALIQTAATSYAVWTGAVLGPDQEAFVRFDSVTANAPQHCLLLKVQRTTWTGGAIAVSYMAGTSTLTIYTYSPGTGWMRRGVPMRNVRFEPGDQMGARATPEGIVTAYRNGVAIGSASIAGWEYAIAGGRVGLLLRGADRTRLVDFGGGDAGSAGATPPIAAIAAPAERSIQPAGDAVMLVGVGTDVEDPSAALRFRWRVDLRRGPIVRSAAADSFLTAPGTQGVIPIHLVVTDRTGRADTATTSVIMGTPTLDHFDRADGAPGEPWAGMTSAYAIRNHALTLTGSTGYMTWGPPFGADQEAWMQFDSLNTSAPEHDLILKSQGPSWSAGAIVVVYTASLSKVVVSTYTPGVGWTPRGGPWSPVVFARGDRFGARALADGRVQAFKNGSLIGETSVAAWPYSANGGRIGLLLSGATRTRIARYGGGTLTALADIGAGGVAGGVGTELGEPDVGDGVRGPGRIMEVSVSNAVPNPVTHNVAFAVELPRGARVGFTVFDLQGREVWREPLRDVPAGRAMLRWNGEDRRGGPAAIGLYLARVTVDGARFLRRFTVLR